MKFPLSSLALIFLVGCGASKGTHPLPMETQTFEGAKWYTVRYVFADGRTCALFTRRETWWDPGYEIWDERRFRGRAPVNMDRGYSESESRRYIETKLCRP